MYKLKKTYKSSSESFDFELLNKTKIIVKLSFKTNSSSQLKYSFPSAKNFSRSFKPQTFRP